MLKELDEVVDKLDGLYAKYPQESEENAFMFMSTRPDDEEALNLIFRGDLELSVRLLTESMMVSEAFRGIVYSSIVTYFASTQENPYEVIYHLKEVYDGIEKEGAESEQRVS